MKIFAGSLDAKKQSLHCLNYLILARLKFIDTIGKLGGLSAILFLFRRRIQIGQAIIKSSIGSVIGKISYMELILH